jgi:vacuolar protein sorting-associated protein 18
LEALGIYHGQLNFQSPSDDMIDGASLLAYPNSDAGSSSLNSPQDSSAPVSIALTEFHFILLLKNRVIGICTLDEKTVYEESLPLVRMIPLHMVKVRL